MDKKHIREHIQQQFKNHSRMTLQKCSQSISIKLIDFFQKTACQNIGLYWALPSEVDLSFFFQHMLHEQGHLCFPRVESASQLSWHIVNTESQLCKGAFSLREPDASCLPIELSQIEAVLVPGLAFDEAGNRLGRGKGYYDRALHAFAGLRVGVCFGFQYLPHIPHETHDEKMHYVVHENDFVRCTVF